MKEWAAEFYAGEAWAKTRAAYLAVCGGLCQRCLKAGDIEPAKIVHHKIYLRPENIDDPRVSLCWDNLEALCQDCHNREHHGRRRRARYRYGTNGELLPENYAAEEGRAERIRGNPPIRWNFREGSAPRAGDSKNRPKRT